MEMTFHARNSRYVVALGVIVLGVGLLLAGPAAAQGPGVLKVGSASAACPAPTQPTIVAAVAAATPGATILVCPHGGPQPVRHEQPLR